MDRLHDTNRASSSSGSDSSDEEDPKNPLINLAKGFFKIYEAYQQYSNTTTTADDEDLVRNQAVQTHPSQASNSLVATLQVRLGYDFKDSNLLLTAFTHRSYLNEHRETSQHNERLEFLGDSVLGMIIADYLYEAYPNKSEGDLTDFRTQLVRESACEAYLEQLGVGQYLCLGKGVQHTSRIKASLFEAIIGAIYRDGDLRAAEKFIDGHFGATFSARLDNSTKNWKAELQDYAQKAFGVIPSYQLLKMHGPEHSKTFVVAAKISGEKYGEGQGNSKQKAEQVAAQQAYRRFTDT